MYRCKILLRERRMCRTWLRSPQNNAYNVSGADNAGGLVLAASPMAKVWEFLM